MRRKRSGDLVLVLVFLIMCFVFLFSGCTSSSLSSKSSACKWTLRPHRKLCRWMLSSFNSSSSSSLSSSAFNYSHLSIKQSLKHAHRLSRLINGHMLSDMDDDGPLCDCAQLFDLNVDYLQQIKQLLRSSELTRYGSAELIGRVQTLLSGVITNQQTCYDGINWTKGLASVLHAPMLNGTQIYSIALGLVTHALRRFSVRVDSPLRHKNSHYTPPLLKPSHASWKPAFNLFQVIKDKVKSIEWESSKRDLELDLASNGIIIRDAVVVSPYGDGNFSTINEAIEFTPNNSKVEDGYFIIYIKAGYYQEYVTVSKHKQGIMMLGDGINRTVIAGNRSVVDGWTTFNSATFVVCGERFVAIGITFVNMAGPEKQQAVAVRNNADLSSFYRCSFMGYQDTLYVHSMRQFYKECDIYGTVDFIFGNSACVFQNCNLYARKPLPGQKNSLTAQGRSDPNQSTGISIHNCTIQAAPDLAAMDPNMSTLSYLGRPWHNYSRTVYMQSYIGDLIDPLGWLPWNDATSVDTVFYGEFDNYGPGANTSFRVQWAGYKLMNATDAVNFTVYNFTMGDTWLPYANIPFEAGLL